MSEEPKGIVKDLIEAQEKIEKEWYKCPECGAEGHNTHYAFCSKVKKFSIATDFGKDGKPHLYLHGITEVDKNKVVKNFHASHITVDDNFLEQIGLLKSVNEDSVSVKKYNKLKNDFADFKIKYFRLILLIFLLGTIFGFVFGVLLPSGGG